MCALPAGVHTACGAAALQRRWRKGRRQCTGVIVPARHVVSCHATVVCPAPSSCVGCARCLQGYDVSIVPLVVTIVAAAAAAVCSLAGVLVLHARAAVYARPLSFHADVLSQR